MDRVITWSPYSPSDITCKVKCFCYLEWCILMFIQEIAKAWIFCIHTESSVSSYIFWILDPTLDYTGEFKPCIPLLSCFNFSSAHCAIVFFDEFMEGWCTFPEDIPCLFSELPCLVVSKNYDLWGTGRVLWWGLCFWLNLHLYRLVTHWKGKKEIFASYSTKRACYCDTENDFPTTLIRLFLLDFELLPPWCHSGHQFGALSKSFCP